MVDHEAHLGIVGKLYINMPMEYINLGDGNRENYY